ncbi:MAG TPA: hypothetical protein VGN23_02560 [Verrucomicrobiae bacterium]|jgi:3-oxoacyl-(acyl-carrier-protein) synthase
MSGIFVHGVGAVSPAGWSTAELRAALGKNVPLPFQNIARPRQDKPLRELIVPPPSSRPAFFTHPRLRRATTLAQHSVAAALEAIGGDVAKIQSSAVRLGIVAGVLSGTVNYTRRFYEEVLREPATASPLIFPETVFNSAASHLGAFLGSDAVSYTIVGDDGIFLQGLALAAQWLMENRVDACIIVGMEESEWITAEAVKLFHRDIIHSAGAGAVYLKKEPTGAMAELAVITDAHSYTYEQDRVKAAKKMRAQLPSASIDELLCNGNMGIARLDAPENEAWKDWSGTRISPKRILGEALVASAAWQCVAACDALASGKYPAVNVSIVGPNQQAIGARFEKWKP